MENKEAIDALKDIRGMMEKSVKCLSISRLSGIFMGIYAILGAITVKYLLKNPFGLIDIEQQLSIAGVAALTLILAIATAAFLSERKAKKTGDSIFSRAARRVHTNLFICLLPGGILSIAMGISGNTQYITTIMLCFYGLALISVSRYTFNDILYLGCWMLFLGMVNSFFTQYSLIFWTLGFGILHISYGVLMYFKYERKAK